MIRVARLNGWYIMTSPTPKEMNAPSDMVDERGEVAWAGGEATPGPQLGERPEQPGAGGILDVGHRGGESGPGGEDFGNLNKWFQHG